MDNQFQQTYQEVKKNIQANIVPNENKYSKLQFIILGVIIGAVMFAAGFISSQIQTTGSFNFVSFLTNYKNSRVNNTYTLNNGVITGSVKEDGKFERLSEIIQILKDNYVDKNVDEKKMINGAIKGLVTSLDDDPTAYFTEEDTAEYKKAITGSFEGIGAELAYSNGMIYIKRLLPDSPASKAGVKVGEFIIQVDDYKVVKDDNINDVVQKIRGVGGTEVTIKFSDNVEGNNARDVKIIRGPIVSKSMDYEDKGNGLVLIRLSRFTESTLEDFEKEWDNLVNDVLKLNPKNLILDLRGNPGGYLDGAYYIASEFLSVGKTVLHVEGRTGIEHTYIVNRTGKLENIPMVVLVNEGSASASEIFSGAMQQAGRAKLIGSTTFGKGTAQKVIEPTSWGGASLHFTVQRWLLPDKRNITKLSPIVPDILKETTIEDIKMGHDPVMQEAIKTLTN